MHLAGGREERGPGWVGGIVFAVTLCVCHPAPDWGACSGHFQLTLSWPQSPSSLPTFSSCFPRKTPFVPMATDPASAPSPAPRKVEMGGGGGHQSRLPTPALHRVVTKQQHHTEPGQVAENPQPDFGVWVLAGPTCSPTPETLPACAPAWRHYLFEHALEAPLASPIGVGWGGCTAHPGCSQPLGGPVLPSCKRTRM